MIRLLWSPSCSPEVEPFRCEWLHDFTLAPPSGQTAPLSRTIRVIRQSFWGQFFLCLWCFILGRLSGPPCWLQMWFLACVWLQDFDWCIDRVCNSFSYFFPPQNPVQQLSPEPVWAGGPQTRSDPSEEGSVLPREPASLSGPERPGERLPVWIQPGPLMVNMEQTHCY